MNKKVIEVGDFTVTRKGSRLLVQDKGSPARKGYCYSGTYGHTESTCGYWCKAVPATPPKTQATITKKQVQALLDCLNAAAILHKHGHYPGESIQLDDLGEYCCTISEDGSGGSIGCTDYTLAQAKKAMELFS